MSNNDTSAIDYMRTELTELEAMVQGVFEKWQASTQDLAEAKLKIIELTAQVDRLRLQNAALRRSLLRHRQAMFPGSDQAAALDREYPPL